MTTYQELGELAWFKDLRRYPVVVLLESRNRGVELYDNNEFLGMLENGNFRGVCLHDEKFVPKLLELAFMDFLMRMKWKNRFNFVYKLLGFLVWFGLVGAAGWLAWTRPLQEEIPRLQDLVQRLTFGFDKPDFKNPHAVSALLVGTAMLVGWILHELWLYFALTRYGFC
ncbi:MAG: hypothetical protein IT195_13740, partial [Microthrixaceae bacterium]|nr:hypothetical protein [Microthrixaceae bacterium]